MSARIGVMRSLGQAVGIVVNAIRTPVKREKLLKFRASLKANDMMMSRYGAQWWKKLFGKNHRTQPRARAIHIQVKLLNDS